MTLNETKLQYAFFIPTVSKQDNIQLLNPAHLRQKKRGILLQLDSNRGISLIPREYDFFFFFYQKDSHCMF